MAFFSMGEGWHNYHHVFPWDYRTAEMGITSWTTKLIEFFAQRGWAWDLKQPSHDLVAKTALKNGDGYFKVKHELNVYAN